MSERGRRSRTGASVVSLVLAIGLIGVTAGAAGAYYGFRVKGGGPGGAQLRCDGGMTRLSHVFDETASVFPGDPPPDIEVVFEVDPDGFRVEQVDTGTHTGTHIDAPRHFYADGVSVDELAAEDLVWPAYVIDVRPAMAAEGRDDFQLTVGQIKAYERKVGRIPAGAMVIIQTGFDAFFGTSAYLDDTPGFSGEAVQWLFDHRRISGLGSDTFGPDASSDVNFSATDTALANGGVTVPGLNNVDALNLNGDIIIAGAVRLREGSGYQVDPLACHRRPRGHR